ncbi:MAG: GNAT family N-acetyltransferase [Planctomycetota bacterium]
MPHGFRVEQVAGHFDLSLGEESARDFAVEVPGTDEDWSIGAIVGPSGSGKSVVAREAFGNQLIERYQWDDRAVVAGFEPPDADLSSPEALSVRDITGMLSAVGFSSPPAWVLPYAALSNGQRFRADLARALLTAGDLVVFDEFTSLVDRQVAKAGSAAVAKAVRRRQGQRFVAVTCHYDVLDWLEPDWVLDMAAGKLARGRVQRRPPIDLRICQASRRLWPNFEPHHYLSGRLHSSAWCYAVTWEDRPVAFLATLHNVSPGGPKYRRAHRLVVLPDYQGFGIGTRLLETVADLEVARGNCERFSLVTSHPALIRSLARREGWACSGVNKGNKQQAGFVAARNEQRAQEHARHAFRCTARFVRVTPAQREATP